MRATHSYFDLRARGRLHSTELPTRDSSRSLRILGDLCRVADATIAIVPISPESGEGAEPESTGPVQPAQPVDQDGFASPHWTAARVQLHGWLRSEAPALAPVYEAAVRMAFDPVFPGRVWFIAHALRDIRNRLPDALAGPVSESRTKYSDLAKEISRCWVDDGLPVDGRYRATSASEPTPAGPERIQISRSLFEAVGDLVDGDLAIAPRKEDAAVRMFAAVAGGPVPRYVVVGWIRATNRAETYAHVRDQPLTLSEEAQFLQIFLECESALIAMSSRSYENMDALDEILDSANS
jgi:hypothetical protein